jgi:predicted DNA-binding transcriptional regulator AlpA
VTLKPDNLIPASQSRDPEGDIDSVSRDRILRIREILKLTGLGRTAISPLRRGEQFLVRRKLGHRSVSRLASEVLARREMRIRGNGGSIVRAPARGER